MSNVTIFKKRDIWWMQYRINGSRVRKSLSTKSETIAKRRANNQQEKLRKGEEEHFRKRVKLNFFWDNYLPYAQSLKRPKTVKNDRLIWARFCQWLTNKQVKYFDQISEQKFESYRISALNRGLKKASINVDHRHLSSMISYAVKQGFIGKNPLLNIKQFKVIQKVPNFLSKEEIHVLIDTASQHSREMHLVYALGIYAGFRRSEIAHARWEWFSFESNIIVLQSFENFIPKSHRMRPIPMHKKLRDILQTYSKNDGYLFQINMTEQERRNVDRYDFKKSFNTVKLKAGLDWITPHSLRHTFASQLAKEGVSLYKIQQWLGHSDPKTTMIYAHLQAQDDEINLI